MLKIGAVLNFILAIGHLLVLPWLNQAFQYYGIDGVMSIVASYGAVLPYIITVCLAIGFAIFGLYALSADGYIRKYKTLYIPF